jgi:phage terminase small subunit
MPAKFTFAYPVHSGFSEKVMVKAMKSPKLTAPIHLMPETQQWWLSVAEQWQLEPHHLKLLSLAAETWDRSIEARETIAREGAYYNDRFNAPHAHPAVKVENDCRVAFSRLVRELDLDAEEAVDSKRPPMLARYRGR